MNRFEVRIEVAVLTKVLTKGGEAPPPVGKAGFEVWVFTTCSNMQTGPYCRVSPPVSTCPSLGEVR